MKRPPIIDRAELEASETGRELTDEQQAKKKQDELLLELLSENICTRLENAGAKMRIGTFHVLGTVTGAFTEKTAYRNCNMIPTVQARNTHGLMRSVQYWMDQQNPKAVRMWVFSKGWTSILDYRRAHSDLTRFISKLASSDLLKGQGIEIVYYAIENTIKHVKRQGDEIIEVPKGTPGATVMLNLHAHCLVRTTHFLPADVWNNFLSAVKRKAPRGYLHDSAMKKAAEVVKYVFKPLEFEAVSDEQLAHIFSVCQGLRFHTPLGELREFRADLKAERLKLKTIMNRHGQSEWRLYRPPAPKEKREDRPTGETPQNMILAVTSPSPAFSGVYEPCLIVKDFTGWPALLAQNPAMAEQIEAIRRAAERNRAYWRDFERRRPSFIKDTTTTTVLNDACDFPSEIDTDGRWWLPPDPPEVSEWLSEAACNEFEGLDHTLTTGF